MLDSTPPPSAYVRAYLNSPEVRAAEADLARARAAILAQADAAIQAADVLVQAAQGALLAGPASSLRNLLSSSRKFKLPPRDTRPSFSRPESLEHSDEDTRPAGYCIKDK